MGAWTRAGTAERERKQVDLEAASSLPGAWTPPGHGEDCRATLSAQDLPGCIASLSWRWGIGVMRVWGHGCVWGT